MLQNNIFAHSIWQFDKNDIFRGVAVPDNYFWPIYHVPYSYEGLEIAKWIVM